MKTYILMISRYFPSYHCNAGWPTLFLEMIAGGNGGKIHTIRNNWELWQRRIKAVNEGKAVLSVRYWSGKPYKSKQVEFLRLSTDQVGFQKLERTILGYFIDDVDSDITTALLAKNDGLSTADFIKWFKGILPFDKAFAIIHLTKFRYKNSASCS